VKRFWIVLVLLLAAGCANPPTPTQSPRPSVNAPRAGKNEYRVVNPSSGAALLVQIFFPDTWDGHERLPALILVPGGNGNSATFLKKSPTGESNVSMLNDAGIVAVLFDPDGRGRSEGTEDYDGFIQQDGLAEIIRFTAALDGIDSEQIGLASRSYGVTMASGVLARYPDLPIKFFIDWEGPADRNDTGGCDAAHLGHLKNVASCNDEDFWMQREAITFIPNIRVPYQRIQSAKDHVQPDTLHALAMVNAAVEGGVPWVRLNDYPPNQTYDLENPPAMLSEQDSRDISALILRYALERFSAEK
jgi:dipeptidyl aminopeptidase/acylaminoacyl peptidase